MWRSLLLGKLSISIAVSALVGAYGIWAIQNPEIETSEYYSWLAVSIFFFALAAVQATMIVFMFRKKKFS